MPLTHLQNAMASLARQMGKKRCFYSMGINNDCLQATPRGVSGQAMAIKKQGNQWKLDIYGPRKLHVAVTAPTLDTLFATLKSAIEEAQWCQEFLFLAESGELAFQKA